MKIHPIYSELKQRLSKYDNVLFTLEIQGALLNDSSLFWYNQAKESYHNMVIWCNCGNREMFDFTESNFCFAVTKAINLI